MNLSPCVDNTMNLSPCVITLVDVFKPMTSKFRQEHGLCNRIMVLGVSSHWGKRKGFDDFVSLAKELREPYSVVMVGVDSNQQKTLPGNVICIARTDNTKELAEIYSASDVFVNPTLEDNFPTVNLEALACGTPVVTYRTGGSAESIDDGCGIAVDKGDVEGLIRAVKNCNIKRSNASGIESCAQQFEKNTKFDEYINIYNSILP